MVSAKKQGLSSAERLKSKKDFDELFSSGKTLISGDNKIKAIYLTKENHIEGVKIAAVVSKKLGNAVWRNRVKRLIKEAYRLNKEELKSASEKKRKSLNLVFSAFALSERKNKKIGLLEIAPSVLEVMRRIIKTL